MKTILILGQQANTEVQLVQYQANINNCRTIVLDTQFMPDAMSLEYLPDKDISALVYEQQRYPLSGIDGVFWSRVDSPSSNTSVNTSIKNKQSNIKHTDNLLERMSVLQILLTEPNINWVNSFAAVQFHRVKPRQLSLAKQLGATIPATYVGNRINAIQSFLYRHPEAIVKPVFSGSLTQHVTSSMQSEESIKTWANNPITLQAFIPGENVRTYIVGDFMISALIQEAQEENADKHSPSEAKEKLQEIARHHPQYSDYRSAHKVTLIPMQLPLEVQQLAVRIMRAFHMQYTAIDWRMTAQGQFVFLEANPAPMFAHAQEQLGVEIDKALVNLLLA